MLRSPEEIADSDTTIWEGTTFLTIKVSAPITTSNPVMELVEKFIVDDVRAGIEAMGFCVDDIEWETYRD